MNSVISAVIADTALTKEQIDEPNEVTYLVKFRRQSLQLLSGWLGPACVAHPVVCAKETGSEYQNIGYRKMDDVAVCILRKLGENLGVIFEITENKN